MEELTRSVRAAFAASERIRSRKESHQDAIYKELGDLSSDDSDNDDSDAPSAPPLGKKGNVVGVQRKDESDHNPRPLTRRKQACTTCSGVSVRSNSQPKKKDVEAAQKNVREAQRTSSCVTASTAVRPVTGADLHWRRLWTPVATKLDNLTQRTLSHRFSCVANMEG